MKSRPPLMSPDLQYLLSEYTDFLRNLTDSTAIFTSLMKLKYLPLCGKFL